MKKLIFFFITIFIMSFVSGTSCSPSSGYDYCWEESRVQDDSRAYAQVQVSNIKGLQKGGYYVGDAWIQYKFKGDKFYIYENANSWDNLWNIAGCDKNGCRGTEVSFLGFHRLTINPGDQYTDCPVFVAHDFDSASDGSWAWQTTGYGWIGSGNCFNIKSVECYDDSDCGSNQICDKSGSWQNWNCEVKVCNQAELKCEGKTHYSCNNNEWVNLGMQIGRCGVECLTGDKCEGTNYYVCENYEWINKGEVVGKCDVQEKIDVYRLENNECNLIDILVSERTSNDYDTLEECEENIEKNPNYLLYVSIAVIVIFIIGVIVLLTKKKARKRK